MNKLHLYSRVRRHFRCHTEKQNKALINIHELPTMILAGLIVWLPSSLRYKKTTLTDFTKYCIYFLNPDSLNSKFFIDLPYSN